MAVGTMIRHGKLLGLPMLGEKGEEGIKRRNQFRLRFDCKAYGNLLLGV